MKTYTIKWDEISDLWFLNEIPKRFVGDHLIEILKNNQISTHDVWSESHALSILKENNIVVNLEDFNGNLVDF